MWLWIGSVCPESDLRKGFHAGAVPFHLTVVGGPGAPHEFVFSRREDEDLQGFEIANSKWGHAAHPQDVILRLGVCWLTVQETCCVEFLVLLLVQSPGASHVSFCQDEAMDG